MRKLIAALLLGAALLPPGAARAELVVGLTNITATPAGALVTFDSATPGTVTAPVAITGLVGGTSERVAGIDYRPSDGALVALSQDSSGRGRVYTLNPTTGVATLIYGGGANPGLRDSGGNEVLLTESNFFSYGIDFNPVANALRIVAANDLNLRITAGGTGTTFVDTALNGPTTGANPNVNAIAYTNNFAGATSTTLYGLNLPAGASASRLQTIGGLNGSPSPNTGQLFDVAALSPSSVNNFTNTLGFDISAATGLAYASLRMTPPNDTPRIYTIDLATGATTLLGTYGGQGLLYDITVVPGVAAVPEPSSCVLLAVGAGLIGYTRRRTRGQTA
jgi:hypothetical protein